MKKVLFILAAFLMVASLKAQKGKMSIGGGFAYGTEIEKLGINFRGYYGITDEIDAAPSFTYFFPNKIDYFTGEIKWNVWELNLDGHYNFTVSEEFLAYGIGGLNITGTSWKSEYEWVNPITGQSENHDESDSDINIGLNIGGGGQYSINDQLGLFGDIKYVIGDYDQLVLTFGIIYGL
ncbi:MAG: outer membrane beta-barrel protein [Bacteroidales bacterium]|nr:outer membrane beta-barrel protein [Bacteroidales bacterium]